ncbi:MAG: penicillin-binding protein 2, partial [Patescibacteria group bacterium]
MAKNRLIVFLIISAFSFVLVLSRFFYWQIIRGPELSALAQKQRTQFLEVAAPRGKIYASDGQALVLNKPSFMLYTYLPQVEEELSSLANRLAPILAEDQTTEIENETDQKKRIVDEELRLKEQLSSDRKWMIIKRKVDENQKDQVDQLKISGLGFESETSRDYPEASMAAQLLGFVGQNETGQPQGYFGLEGFYNQQLTGLPGLIMEEKGIGGQFIFNSKRVKENMNPGLNLVLYLDRVAQFILEEELVDGVERYGAQSGWGVIMTPDGQVLAMAGVPSYDPSDYSSFESQFFANPVVAKPFEPGSIFKPIVMASALDLGLVEPDSKCDQCAGPKLIAGHQIRTWNDQYYPDTTMTEVIVHSDNVGMVFVAEKLGRDQMIESLEKFGLDQKTGIDLQDEANISLRPKSQWYPIDVASASFGQGISTTAIQLIRAFATLANDGKISQPKLVKTIQKAPGQEQPGPKIDQEKIISSKTCQEITQMLFETVENGDAKWTKPKNLTVAGKTGTAQIAIEGNYDESKTIASFIGFAP